MPTPNRSARSVRKQSAMATHSVAGEFSLRPVRSCGAPKRTGRTCPPLARSLFMPGQRPHLYNPRSVVPESNMPGTSLLVCFGRSCQFHNVLCQARRAANFGCSTRRKYQSAAPQIEGKFEIDKLCLHTAASFGHRGLAKPKRES